MVQKKQRRDEVLQKEIYNMPKTGGAMYTKDELTEEGVDLIDNDTDVDEYILPYSDSEYLEMGEVEGLTKEECRIARNEIYARHGRLFRDEELQAYFDGKDWYDGYLAPDEFDETVLNDYEIYNRDLIVEYEKTME